MQLHAAMLGPVCMEYMLHKDLQAALAVSELDISRLTLSPFPRPRDCRPAANWMIWDSSSLHHSGAQPRRRKHASQERA